MNEKIKQLIKKYEEPGDFNYAEVTEEMIKQAEHKLNVILPKSYIEFVRTYGHGGIAGVDTMGIGLDGSIIFMDETFEYREEDLPANLVVIENADEWLYCIDCNTEKIVSWDMDGYIKEEFESFDEYLISQMEDAIENL